MQDNDSCGMASLDTRSMELEWLRFPIINLRELYARVPIQLAKNTMDPYLAMHYI